MLGMKHRYSQGDTIIEVVLAFAIFTLAAVGTITIINNGLSVTQRNLEITQVRQQVDSQAELLRYLRATKSANTVWADIINPNNLVDSPTPLANTCNADPMTNKGFFVRPAHIDLSNPANTTFERTAVGAATFVSRDQFLLAGIDYTSTSKSNGIWVQAATAQQASSSSVKAYDFYIHACWDSVGLDTPMTLGTIVRIYE